MSPHEWRMTEAEREKTILAFLPLVNRIAARVYIPNPAVLDKDDLVSQGIIALMEAMERYNPERDTAIESYVYRRVRGAMVDAIRATSFSSRAANDRVKQYREAEDRLLAQGELPTDQNIARTIGISVEQVQEMLVHVFLRSVVSLDRVLYSDDGDEVAVSEAIGSAASPNPVQVYEEHEMSQRLAAALNELPMRDRQLLNMYYVEELTLKEIASVFDVTEGRVSQLHARAILRLRELLRGRGQ